MNLAALEREFPREDIPGFIDYASEEWHNLLDGKTEGSRVSAASLYRQLKPKRGRIKKFTVFVIWLILCIERPWERAELRDMNLNDMIEDGQIKAWRFSFNVQRGKNFWDKIDGILCQIFDNYPDDLQLRTLRIQLRKGQLKSAVFGKLLFDPSRTPSPVRVSSKWGELLSYMEKLGKILVSSRQLQALRLLNFLKKEKYVRKIDLMRKFSMNKARCDYLLKYILSENESLINIVEGLSDSTVWIVYKGRNQEQKNSKAIACEAKKHKNKYPLN